MSNINPQDIEGIIYIVIGIIVFVLLAIKMPSPGIGHGMGGGRPGTSYGQCNCGYCGHIRGKR